MGRTRFEAVAGTFARTPVAFGLVQPYAHDRRLAFGGGH
jgi:hypothetical protein